MHCEFLCKLNYWYHTLSGKALFMNQLFHSIVGMITFLATDNEKLCYIQFCMASFLYKVKEMYSITTP